MPTRAVLALVTLVALAGSAAAQNADPAATDHEAIAKQALEQSVLPGFERLVETTETLAKAAEDACAAGEGPIDAAPVRAAYDAAFDAWIGVEHLRFGPAEENNAAFSLAFWPDTKGSTPKSLRTMIASEDPVVKDPAAFAQVSIAARGFFALDWLMFDPEAGEIAAGGYRCDLLKAITRDAATTSAGMLARWHDPWGQILTSAGDPENPVYLAPEESTKALYSALNDQLQSDIDLRLGRPMGTFERSQPRRAEAWRSNRSLHNVEQSLISLRAYAATVFGPAIGPEEAAKVDSVFDAALAAVGRVGEPIDVAVAAIQGRVRVEALQTAVRHVQTEIAEHVGPAVGVTSGFNAMDGD